MSERIVIGLRPWLPWPLAGWRWWTEPVRAERLAALRIGLALVLLVDLLYSYLPQLHDFFGPDRLGQPKLFDYMGEAPRWYWSALRGFRDPLIYSAALSAWAVATCAVLVGLWGRLSAAADHGRHPVLRGCLIVWVASAVVGVLGLWARLTPPPEHADTLIWRAPMFVFGVATLFWCLGLWKRLLDDRDDPDPWIWRWVLIAWVVSGALAGLGLWKWAHLDSEPDGPAFLRWTQVRWHDDATALHVAMLVWIAATVLLLVGCCTRLSAVAVWALSVSFANINTYIDNAGDQVRTIVLFYLMLCPCGAVWSVDSWLARRRGPVYVYPWPLRLLFVQMVLIYFCNGLYKVVGEDWTGGTSLYHVLCDLTLTRVSYAQFPVPLIVTQVMTWLVLAWEVGFPLWVALKWTRVPALVFGVLFHLGIMVSMELGGFGPYMLTLYLPLLPWERWLGPKA